MRKTVSWTITLVLILSSLMITFAGDTENSTSMKDAANILNIEAVDVMIATGIIIGFPDGNYYPENTVTRAEMAKMICFVKNGGQDVGDYYKSLCKFEDSKDRWAAGYIGYCTDNGIIDGRSESVFDPKATVTGTEAAKMILISLGYDSKIEGYTGTQRETKVLKDANANGLFNECYNFVPEKALTRDNAAQMIFNGLKAMMVEYNFDAEVNISDAAVTVNTTVDKIKDEYGNEIALYKDTFSGNLVYEVVNDSNLEEIAHKWIYKQNLIGVYFEKDR